MKKLVTISLTIALMSVAANAAPMLIYQANDLGGGLTEYIFTLDATSETSAGAFATTSLTFSGNIQQQKAFGALHVHDEFNANIWDVNPGAGYNKATDTWLYDGWSPIAPDDTNMLATSPFQPLTGQDVILSLGSGTTPVAAKNLIRIVAIGDVEWDGLFAFGAGASAQDYLTSGTATPGAGVVVDAGENDGPDKYSFGAGGDGPIGDGGSLGFQLHGSSDPVGGAVAWFISGPGLVGDVPLPIDLGSPDDLNPIIIFADLAAIGAISRNPNDLYTVTLDVDGTTDSAALHLPEPATMGLMLFGAIGLVARKRRRN